MPGAITVFPASVIKERAKLLSDMNLEFQAGFAKKFIDKEVEVIYENKEKNGYFSGYTSEYVKMFSLNGPQNSILSQNPTAFNKSEIALID